jgi:hypothetical protein
MPSLGKMGEKYNAVLKRNTKQGKATSDCSAVTEEISLGSGEISLRPGNYKIPNVRYQEVHDRKVAIPPAVA